MRIEEDEWRTMRLRSELIGILVSSLVHYCPGELQKSVASIWIGEMTRERRYNADKL
ncbi:hypothetical protein [Bacillus changyiensis]|uniref:hypothetical protein n=1 Tax=Bacillus changyiensis TaxID=3004103 RepID=UPI0022E4B7A8|nr:hypothetical protein [Bacillus changyiensis]MDA1476830.1 hypothetical protein [Bacillus changyiensis]